MWLTLYENDDLTENNEEPIEIEEDSDEIIEAEEI